MSSSVIRPVRDGPEGVGLAFWGNCESEPVIAGSPVEHGHEYFVDATGAYSSGVWECTAYTADFESYPFDEFGSIISGEVTITDGDGNAETFKQGDCYIIPKGLKCTWHMPEKMRKFYVMFDTSKTA